jgi:hypothetical protein
MKNTNEKLPLKIDEFQVLNIHFFTIISLIFRAVLLINLMSTG